VSRAKQNFHINSKLNLIAGSGGTIDNSGQIESAIDIEHPESLANNSRSNNAVCSNQQVAQPVVATTARANTVFSRLDTEEVDTVSAVRFCNSFRLNSQPMLKLAQDGLIKIQSSLLTGSPGSLQDFCKFGDRAPRLC